jgi:AcrR family transcriptional regulator
MEGASMREIARQAGYTPGAIYSYFESKEAIYGALLAESLERLQAAVAAAADAAMVDGPAAALQAGAGACFGFYAASPRDLDLGLYLLRGMRTRGLDAGLMQGLNEQLQQALLPCERALAGMGLSQEQVLRENTALFAHGMGLLLLPHSGGTALFSQDAGALFQAYTEALMARLQACPAPLQEPPKDANAARR